MPNLNFREANVSDAPSIVTIHNSNAIANLNSIDGGFLLSDVNEKAVVDQLSRSTRYFVATLPNKEIIGFVCVSRPKISAEMLTKIQWEDTMSYEKVQDPRHLFLHVVATRRNWSSQGVGQFMYRSLYDSFPSSFISLFVVVNPIANQRSMNFHTKQGFKKIGTIKADRFLDFKNYEEVLMLKET